MDSETPTRRRPAEARSVRGAALRNALIAVGALACAVSVAVWIIGGNDSETPEPVVSNQDTGDAAAARPVAMGSTMDSATDAAMDAAIARTSRDVLAEFKHSAIRVWPYVIFLEDFGDERVNERYAKDYRVRITAFYDYMKKTYPNVVNKEPETPFRIIVLRDRASFNKFNALNGNGALAGARAFYHPQAKFIYTYEQSPGGVPLFVRGVVFHECTHQLLDFLRPKNRYNESIWFEEAIADFHAGAKIQPVGDGGFTYEPGHLNRPRLNQMARALERKNYFSLPLLFQCRTYGEADAAYKRKFGGDGGRGKGLLYYQGWSFIYFCMVGPNKAHREAIFRYIDQDVGQGEGDYNILNQAFEISDSKQWEPIQREWEAYVRSLIEARNAARATDRSR